MCQIIFYDSFHTTEVSMDQKLHVSTPHNQWQITNLKLIRQNYTVLSVPWTWTYCQRHTNIVDNKKTLFWHTYPYTKMQLYMATGNFIEHDQIRMLIYFKNRLKSVQRNHLIWDEFDGWLK